MLLTGIGGSLLGAYLTRHNPPEPESHRDDVVREVA